MESYLIEDSKGYWIDQSEEAYQYRSKLFNERSQISRCLERFDLDSTVHLWERWCGPSPWSEALREFGSLGGYCEYWCGVPRSASAIPLCFALYDRKGREIPGNSRLKDIKAAIKILKEEPHAV